MKCSHVIAIGAIVALLVYTRCRIAKGPRIYARDRLPGGFNAMTVPPIGIFITRDQLDNQALLDHEMVHWRQFQEMGLLPYYGRYFYEKLRYGYDDMPMEMEAREGESFGVMVNYTEAVRNGTAKTVYNPNFRL